MSEKSYNIIPNERVSSGIKGLDEMLGGGFPSGHIITVIGDSGTGKTTLALQYIMAGLLKDEPGIYISIEEEKESIISTAKAYGWDVEKYIEEKKLVLLKLDLTDIKTTARMIKSELPQIIESFGAKRLAIDSLTLYSIMFSDLIERRIRLVELNKAIKKSGITSLFTSEVDANNPHHSNDGMVEYSSDGVLILQQKESEKHIKLMIRIIKMRRTQHDRSYRPYEITGDGILVYSNEMLFNDVEIDAGFTKAKR